MLSLQVRLGRAIQRLRTAAGYSQEKFADAVGFHRTYGGAIERGERNLTLRNIERIANALGVTVAELFAEAERDGQAARLRAGRPRRGQAVPGRRGSHANAPRRGD